MGGFGSGGRGGWQRRRHVTIEGAQSLTLDLSEALRTPPGWRGQTGPRSTPAPVVSATVCFRTPEGRQTARLLIVRDTEAGTGTATLAFNIRRGTHETGPQRQTIDLGGVPRPFGGWQWFFLCPATGRRAVKLFLPYGCSRFLSRRGYGLKYQCQHEPPETRAYRRIYAVNRRLRHVGPFDAPPAKPPWMRWHTFDRLAEKREAAFVFIDGKIVAFLDRMTRQDGGGGHAPS